MNQESFKASKSGFSEVKLLCSAISHPIIEGKAEVCVRVSDGVRWNQCCLNPPLAFCLPTDP